MPRAHANPVKQGCRAIELAPRTCKCTHSLGEHRNGECLHHDVDGRFCRCKVFVPIKR